MKNIIYVVLLFIAFGCTTKYIPVESTRTKYVDRLSVDTFVRIDSLVEKSINETIYIEKYRTIYRNKIIKDTINRTDTISKTVQVIKEVNRIHDWQLILMVLGGGFIALLGYRLIRIIKI